MAVSRLLIHGASGRMGRALLRLLPEFPQLRLVAAVADSDLGKAAGDAPVLRRSDLAKAPVFDVAIDFSQPVGFDGILTLCSARGAALVSGTTGLSDPQREAMRMSAAGIPVLWASNFSLGVAVLSELAKRAARALPGWQADIVETHHVHKKDAPSGTAITLAEAVAGAGAAAPRIVSLREGEVIGEHVLRFSGAGEFIELRHSATDRDIFARGALAAASALVGRPSGRHEFAELLLG